MDWSEEAISTLCRLWHEGIQTPEIAQKLGTSKDAVVGKAHRLGLPPLRPLRRQRKDTSSKKSKKGVARSVVRAVPAPEPVVVAPPPPKPRPVPKRIILMAFRMISNSIAADSSPSTSPPQSVPDSLSLAATRPASDRLTSCCWPIGEPGTKSFRICEATPTVPKKPYCAEHAGLAYVKVRSSRNERPDAAAA